VGESARRRGRDQLGAVTADGRAAAFTGADCLEWAGHRVGAGYAVQGNILAGEEVADAMARAFEGSVGPLVERLVAALEAGQAAGGDRRGQQSAAVVVERAGAGAESRERIDRVCDLRVEDHVEPIAELRRLVGIWRRWDAQRLAHAAYERAEYAAAADSLERALELGEDGELLYNLGCYESLAGRRDAAIGHVRRALELVPSLRELAPGDPDLDPIRDALGPGR
jgi:uncharacterized Ntn-hydrolase superfamily protein